MPLRERLVRFSDSLSASDKPYLNYFDINLTVGDVRTLKKDWLTDNIIGFWQEYLERETLSRYTEAKICLLRPSMSFMILRSDHSDDAIRSGLPDLSETTHVFLPINNNDKHDSHEGGTHWSLLLVSLRDGIAFHYDSSHGANDQHAHDTTDRLARILRRELAYVHLTDSPQQLNGFDCGVFVCLLMRHLLVKRLLSASARSKINMSMANKVVDSSGGRKEMLLIIENLRKEAERRNSKPGSSSPLPDGRNVPRVD